MTEQNSGEKFHPEPNLPPGGTLWGKTRFFVRLLLDLQVSSVLRQLRPWLAKRTGLLLEVGCGAQPYRHLVPAGCRYSGLEWEGAEAAFSYRAPDTFTYDGGRFPFEDGSYDALFHTEVLEHIYDYRLFLAECHRVLAPSGELFFTVPFQARYHYIPHDYFRYTPAALERLLTEAGFYRIRITPRGNDITVAAYKNISVLYRWLRSGPGGMVAGILLSPLALPFLLVGWLSLRIPMGSPDDCLGYAVTAETGTKEKG